MNVSQRGRAALGAAAAAALFGGLAAVGVAAGVRLSAGTVSPPVPPTLAPARAARVPVTPPGPDISWAIVVINGPADKG